MFGRKAVSEVMYKIRNGEELGEETFAFESNLFLTVIDKHLERNNKFRDFGITIEAIRRNHEIWMRVQIPAKYYKYACTTADVCKNFFTPIKTKRIVFVKE